VRILFSSVLSGKVPEAYCVQLLDILTNFELFDLTFLSFMKLTSK
jgi:hypothetical protein